MVLRLLIDPWRIPCSLTDTPWVIRDWRAGVLIVPNTVGMAEPIMVHPWEGEERRRGTGGRRGGVSGGGGGGGGAFGLMA